MTRRTTTTAPTLEGYSLVEKMAFIAGWSPAEGRGRWRTWREYLADYRRLRPALV